MVIAAASHHCVIASPLGSRSVSGASISNLVAMDANIGDAASRSKQPLQPQPRHASIVQHCSVVL